MEKNKTITYEQAIILKDLDFQEYCTYYYTNGGERKYGPCMNYALSKGQYASPVFSHICQWLKGKYRIKIKVIKRGNFGKSQKFQGMMLDVHNNIIYSKIISSDAGIKEKLVTVALSYITYKPEWQPIKNTICHH